MKRHQTWILGIVLFVVLGPRLGGKIWPHDHSDLKPDEAVSWGVLGNGIRYAIMPNPEPPGRVSLRLLVEAGSLMERDDEKGLAHFLEHMAFNGSRNFPAGELVEYLQRLGMSFGADTNAHTSWDETVYYLELPRNDEETLDEGLRIFRDYADGLLLEGEQIDRERGVILSEKRSRDSAEFRLFKKEIAFLLPNALMSQRLPIGEEAVLNELDRRDFRRFYRRWYSSRRMVLVAVGDVDPKTVKKQIGEHFSSLRARRTRRDPDRGKVTEFGRRSELIREPEASAATVSIQTLRPYSFQPDTTKRRREELLREVASSMVERRFEILAKAEDAAFSQGSAYAYTWLDFVDVAGIELTTRPEHWERAMKTAEQESRRALRFGFTNAELEEAKAKILNAYEQAVREAPTRNSRRLARTLVGSISHDRVFTSPEHELEFAGPILKELAPEECRKALERAWNPENLSLVVAGNLEVENGKAAVAAVYEQSLQEPVERPEETSLKAFAYSVGEEAGAIETRAHREDLDITQIRFKNNVRLNLKRSEFEKDTVHFQVRFGGGLLTAPEEHPGLSFLATATFVNGGLVEHSWDEIEGIFAGKTVGVSFSVGSDAFVLRGRTNPKDLLQQLELVRAYLIAPGYRDEAIIQARREFDRLYLQLAQTPRGVLENEVGRFLAGGDFRFGFPEKSELLKRNLEEVKKWLSEPLESEYMEVSIVGDIDLESTIEGVASTLGSLPSRKEKKPIFTDERVISFPDGVREREFSVDSEIPKGLTVVYWPTDDIWDITRTRRLSMLANVFSDRLRVKIREELGEAYSPDAYSRPSDTFTGYGTFYAVSVTDPKEGAKVATLVNDIAADLQANGTNQDELDRTLRPLLNGLKEWVRNNRYWLGTVLGSSQEHPQKLDWALSMVDDYRSISVEDVNRMAREYLVPESSLTVQVVPAGERGSEQ